jgi:hypothetical protein
VLRAHGITLLNRLIKKTALLKVFLLLLYSLLGVVYIASFWALFLTFSRSAWIAGVGATIFLITCLIFIAVKQKRSFKKIMMIAASSISFGILFYLVNPYIFERFQSLETYESSSVSERIDYIKTALPIINRSPLFGVGPNNFINAQVSVVKSTDIPNRYYQPAHIVIFLILVETGIVGAMMVILGTAIFLYALILKIKHDTSVKLGNSSFGIIFLSAWFYIGIISLFDHYFYTIQAGMLLVALLFGLSMWYIFPAGDSE